MISDTIRAWLDTNQRSATFLADRAGITPQALRRIKSGDTLDPRAQTLVRLARAMDLTLDELLADEIKSINGRAM